jgi:hypothetical protein
MGSGYPSAVSVAFHNDPDADRSELRRYLGDAYDERALRGHRQTVLAEHAAAGDDDATLYHGRSHLVLYRAGRGGLRSRAALASGWLRSRA